jgi:hypothetical protein
LGREVGGGQSTNTQGIYVTLYINMNKYMKSSLNSKVFFIIFYLLFLGASNHINFNDL